MNKLLKFALIALSAFSLNSMQAMKIIRNMANQQQNAAQVAIELSKEFYGDIRKSELLFYNPANLNLLKDFLIENPFSREYLDQQLFDFPGGRDLLNFGGYSLINVNNNMSESIPSEIYKYSYSKSDKDNNTWLRNEGNCQVSIYSAGIPGSTCMELFTYGEKVKDILFPITFDQIKTISIYETLTITPDLCDYVIITDIKNQVYIFDATNIHARLMFRSSEPFVTAYFNASQRFIFYVTNDGKTKVIDFGLILTINLLLQDIYKL